MVDNVLQRLLWIIPVIVFAAPAAGDDFPAPPEAKVSSVADDMAYEGMNLNIRRFDVDMPVESVLTFYRDLWDGRYVENDMPPWRMISTKDGGRFYTVQVQPSGRDAVWGYLGISNLPGMLDEGQVPGAEHKPFPMMSGSTVVNDMENNDIGRRGRTLLINNGFSVQGNANYYRDHYESNGWTTVIDQSADPSSNHVLMFQQGSETVNLSIDSGDRGTNIVVNKVSNELF